MERAFGVWVLPVAAYRSSPGQISLPYAPRLPPPIDSLSVHSSDRYMVYLVLPQTILS